LVTKYPSCSGRGKGTVTGGDEGSDRGVDAGSGEGGLGGRGEEGQEEVPNYSHYLGEGVVGVGDYRENVEENVEVCVCVCVCV
jgi:hypothetical protein